SKRDWSSDVCSSDLVLDVETLRAVVEAARAAGVVVASDECYARLGWDGADTAPGILDPRVVGDDHTGVLSVYSLSKQSNLAGYRSEERRVGKERRER